MPESAEDGDAYQHRIYPTQPQLAVTSQDWPFRFITTTADNTRRPQSAPRDATDRTGTRSHDHSNVNGSNGGDRTFPVTAILLSTGDLRGAFVPAWLRLITQGGYITARLTRCAGDTNTSSNPSRLVQSHCHETISGFSTCTHRPPVLKQIYSSRNRYGRCRAHVEERNWEVVRDARAYRSVP
jgi:hypothetical protein